MSSVTSPVAWDLTVAYLPSKVKSSGVTADEDGYYYKARQLVEIVADETVGIATTAQQAIGQLEDSVTVKTAPNGIDVRTRVSVIPFGFRRILRVAFEGDITFGTWVTQGSTSKQAVKAASDVSVSSVITAAVATGVTAMTGDAETGASVNASAVNTVAGGVLPERILGIVWKGATDGNEGLILAY